MTEKKKDHRKRTMTPPERIPCASCMNHPYIYEVTHTEEGPLCPICIEGKIDAAEPVT